MPSTDSYDILIIGSGEAGKWLAWTMGGEGHRTAVVERKLIGGSCPNIACLPSKNIIRSAKVRSFTTRAGEFGVDLESAVTNMAGVQTRKRAMVEGERQFHLERYKATGVELIMGEARFVGERTVEVDLVELADRPPACYRGTLPVRLALGLVSNLILRTEQIDDVGATIVGYGITFGVGGLVTDHNLGARHGRPGRIGDIATHRRRNLLRPSCA